MPVDFRDLTCGVLENINCAFGEYVTYLPCRGGRFTLRATFDHRFEQVDPDTEVVIASNQPALLVKLADLPGSNHPAKRDRFVIQPNSKRGDTEPVTYEVKDAQEDGQGGVLCLMHRITEPD